MRWCRVQGSLFTRSLHSTFVISYTIRDLTCRPAYAESARPCRISLESQVVSGIHDYVSVFSYIFVSFFVVFIFLFFFSLRILFFPDFAGA